MPGAEVAKGEVEDLGRAMRDDRRHLYYIIKV